MRNSFLIILIALIVVGGASYTFVRNKEQRNAELEKLVRKDEAKAKTAEAKKKTAEAEARKAKESAAEAKSKAEAAKDERQARLAAEAEAKELAKAKEAEARKAEADAKIASENARKAEAELKTAEAKKAEAALLVQHAETTNAVRQADLQTALAASHLVELDLQRILAASNTLALQKADYATKLVEVEKLQEELRRREEETRPNKTLLQLMEEEEKALQAELAEMAKKDAAFAKEEEIRRRILRDGVPAAPKKPLSAVDQRLLDANASVENAADEVRSIFEKRMVSRIEALIRQTIKDGRAEDAELYLKSLKSLVPGYEFVP
ncbi:MAG: hypothetical protein J6N18_07710 [Kiritimatiellae bacterium]|nr:hypothetical protein [Kiritimatiellia bacterium]